MRDLNEIWDWNAENQSLALADVYLAFLNREIGKFAHESSPGQSIEERPGFARK